MKQLIILMGGLILGTMGCSSTSKKIQASKIKVSWELVSNVNNQPTSAVARFTLNNQGNFILDSDNWLLYFSMAPRSLLTAGDSVKADVMHINGDWYKLVPRNDFKLKPNETLSVPYYFQGWSIKETDAPQGLYFVFFEEGTEQETIVPVKDYTIAPFERKEQVMRGPNDQESLPTPAKNYKRNRTAIADLHPIAPALIPSPLEVHTDKDSIPLQGDWNLQFDSLLFSEAQYLKTQLARQANITLQTGKRNEVYPRILLEYAPVEKLNNSSEAYQLAIDSLGITIRGAKAGVFYGIQTLLQTISTEVLKSKPGKCALPILQITDAPRFAYRGQHIDVCRNFQSKEQLMKIIDLMARYKLNRLHLYLTEDEGWRLQIKAIPELTSVGARRGHTLTEQQNLPPAYGSGAFVHDPSNHGTGFYSQADFIEILQYANERHIDIIPSINLPGHARAAIVATEARYKRFMEKGMEIKADEFRLIDPDDESVYQSAQFYNDNVVCVARESVYHFFETVIDEVIALYREAGAPLSMIHTGGDEVPEGVWTRSPLCDSLLTKHPEIEDPKNLQLYFFRRINTLLQDRNLRCGGWEEVALVKNNKQEYEVNSDFSGGRIVPYVWNNLYGDQDLAYRIANANYPVVLCSVSNFYFDLAYSNHPKEPGLYWGGFNDEYDAWHYAPYNLFLTTTHTAMGRPINRPTEYAGMERLKNEAKPNILGLQGQLWHETIQGGDMMEYYLLPKLPAFAERCWAKAPVWENIPDDENRQKVVNQEWAVFSETLYRYELPKLAYLNNGYNYRVAPPGAMTDGDTLKLNTINESYSIYYTTDGTTPTVNSAEYTSPISLPDSGKVFFKAYDRAGRESRTIVYPVF